jgi:hypothetical protein
MGSLVSARGLRETAATFPFERHPDFEEILDIEAHHADYDIVSCAMTGDWVSVNL